MVVLVATVAYRDVSPTSKDRTISGNALDSLLRTHQTHLLHQINGQQTALLRLVMPKT